VKWLQDNLPGVILASICAFLLLIAVLLVFVGTRPVSPGDVAMSEMDLELEPKTQPVELEPIGRYRVVTDRPLFNETRRPVIEVEESGQPEAEEVQVEVREAPKVNLTGVVITPEVRLVSLTPQGGGEPMVFGEGRPMRGDYNGWAVKEVSPRSATLESRDGQEVHLALLVHDQLIKEPPKPEPVRSEAVTEEDELADEDPERLSRAEEIRQRIAERREQLRQEAAENEAAAQQPSEEKKPSPYAQAIRNMISQGNSKDKDKDEE
jgi:hypothetical protein